jgi:dihydrofolate synthase / folylpolyglutamate synthase
VAAARLIADVTAEEVTIGLRRLRMPGRFEIVGDVILDGAHNDASAAALARALVEYARGRELSLVLGINRDKDARAVLRPLLPVASRVWATQTADNPRALPAAELARWCARLDSRADVAPDLREALAAAQRQPGLLCVTGSLMLVGQARALLGLAVPERLWD